MNNKQMMRKAQLAKLTKQIIDSPEYRERRKEDDEQNLMRAFACFTLISCDYLYRQFNCKAAGIRKFIDLDRKSVV